VRPQAELFPASPALEYLAAQPQPVRVLDWDTGASDARESFLGIGAPQSMVHGVSTPRGYNPLDVRHYREFIAYVVNDPTPVRGNSPYTQQVLPNFEVGNPELFRLLADEIVPLPGAPELLQALTDLELPWAIATSGRMITAEPNLIRLGLDPEHAKIVTRDQVQFAKPDPDLFVEAARRLGTTTRGSCVIGDSIWDMIAAARCGALGIGLLSGGYGPEELERAGALRVYDDPADMLYHLDEIAPRTRD